MNELENKQKEHTGNVEIDNKNKIIDERLDYFDTLLFFKKFEESSSIKKWVLNYQMLYQKVEFSQLLIEKSENFSKQLSKFIFLVESTQRNRINQIYQFI